MASRGKVKVTYQEKGVLKEKGENGKKKGKERMKNGGGGGSNEGFHKKIADKDRFRFDLRRDDGKYVSHKFKKFILCLRAYIAVSGFFQEFARVIGGERGEKKESCGSKCESVSDKFVLVTFLYDGVACITFLKLKSSCYILGIVRDGELYVVQDFKENADFESPCDSHILNFDSSYKKSPSNCDFGFYLLRDNILNLQRGLHLEQSFKEMCVVISECVRFDSVLREIAKALKLASKNVGLTKAKLTEKAGAHILNWEKIKWDFSKELSDSNIIVI